MIQNHNLAKQIQDVSWGMFIDFLEYKCSWYGKTLVKIDQWFPSSKTCSVCGYKNNDLKLSYREWICPICGTKHDRDITAAVNVKDEGLIQLNQSGCGMQSDLKQKLVEASSIEESVKPEALRFLVSG